MENTINTKAKIKFENLDVSLKIAVILAWISGTLLVLSFLVGFIGGVAK